MSIRLNKPYKIVAYKHERFEAHYEIPSSAALIVPVIRVGDEVACDIRWENENGELKVLHNRMFISENLVELDTMTDKRLFEIWQHYYHGGLLNKHDNDHSTRGVTAVAPDNRVKSIINT